MNTPRFLSSGLPRLVLLGALSSWVFANDKPAAADHTAAPAAADHATAPAAADHAAAPAAADHAAAPAAADHAAAPAASGHAAAPAASGHAVAPAASSHAAAPAVSADAALARLTAGNKRFVAGAPTHPAQSASRRTETAAGQHPFAIVLTCADSRLSPEIIFDQGIGDLFVVRNAGNLLSDHVIGSIEYAVEHLHATLVVVLGHSKCGAVAAAVGGGEVPGHIKSIVTTLEPAAAMGKKKPGDAIENTVRINAKLSAAALAQAEPIVSEFVKAGKVKVVAARYDISSGEVEIFP